MTSLDWVVLLGAIFGIVGYAVWRTRGRKNLRQYLKGEEKTSWITIGLSVMATQASAITFLSTPGQGYADGLRFVQFYFGLPIAMLIIVAVFLPLYRKMNVYTAYEFLGRRFDGKTRLLGACLFLAQRGLGAGLTIYAPSIVISTILGWPLDLTILLSGLLAIVYTVSGGSAAVNLTQKLQMVLIMSGMLLAFFVVIAKLPENVSFVDALHVAGSAGRMQAIDYSFDPNNRYTLWSGIFGGLFLALAYFGTDQSQVQRYLSGNSLRESRLGLMFNAIMKIPMQFFILLLGTLVFAFYQFERPPLFFNQPEWNQYAEQPGGESLRELEEEFVFVHAEKSERIQDWLSARRDGDEAAVAAARTAMQNAADQVNEVRSEALAALTDMDEGARTEDRDYVFLTFVLDYLPHGIIGLLIAAIFSGALSSVSSELNALGSTTVVDIYRNLVDPDASDRRSVVASKIFTAMWGVIALGFAFYFQLAENLIQAVNLIGSIFYGPVLGLFIVAFFLKRIGGTAAFWGAVGAQILVIAVHFTGEIAFLWYNLLGVGSCVIISLLIETVSGGGNLPPPEKAK